MKAYYNVLIYVKDFASGSINRLHQQIYSSSEVIVHFIISLTDGFSRELYKEKISFNYLKISKLILLFICNN